MLIADIVLVVAGAYVLLGLIVGLGFVSRGVGQVDPAARGAPWSFRLLILPAVTALWPLAQLGWPGRRLCRAMRREAAGLTKSSSRCGWRPTLICRCCSRRGANMKN